MIDGATLQALAWAALGCGFTWLMTTAGSAVVLFMRKEPREGQLSQRIFLGFAAGVMIAASVWSLLNPAIEQAEEQGQIGWIPAAGGFVLAHGATPRVRAVVARSRRAARSARGPRGEGLRAPTPGPLPAAS